MTSHSSTATGSAHLVGSIPLSTTDDVLRKSAGALSNHVYRFVDGETGTRQNWIWFQGEVFASHKEAVRAFRGAPRSFSESDIERVMSTPLNIDTQYDRHAIESYKSFVDLRNKGIVPSKSRFQVCLPTPTAVIACFIEPAFRTRIEPHYKAALLRALKHIQTAIPASDLSIQWDLAVEPAFIERVARFGEPWWSPFEQGLIDRIVDLAAHVNDDVDLGFHLCYGDRDHKHWKEPVDLGILAELAEKIVNNLHRPVNFFHMPVPKNRSDDAYFAPLSRLKDILQSTELYLGLVHAHDEEGTHKRIEVAKKFVEHFGVATECGLGRTPQEDIDSIFQILYKVSSPRI